MPKPEPKIPTKLVAARLPIYKLERAMELMGMNITETLEQGLDCIINTPSLSAKPYDHDDEPEELQ